MTIDPATVPVPRDIPLPLPAPAGLLEALLTVAFIAHILFVNLMVGGTLLVLGLELRGRRDAGLAWLARKLAGTITVNKSLAVVLGVAPLLLINVLYTIHFYTANALTGIAWVALLPMIAGAFLLLYLHKYTWDRLAGRPRLHAAILAGAALLLLIVPLVFLANVTLMMFPERWTSVHGFASALLLPSVLPRYVHFLAASLVLTSLFAVGYLDRDGVVLGGGLDGRRVRRVFYTVALVVSLAQFAIGPLVLASLPRRGLSVGVVTPILCGAAFAVVAVIILWRARARVTRHRLHLPVIAGLLSATVLCMAVGRHTYRLEILVPHRTQMRDATAAWQRASRDAARDAREAAAGTRPGERLFKDICGACHGLDHVVVGPPLLEIARLYAGRPEGIVGWASAPGKKRAGFPQMPAFAQLGDAKLHLIATYMLEAGAAAQ